MPEAPSHPSLFEKCWGNDGGPIPGSSASRLGLLRQRDELPVEMAPGTARSGFSVA